MNRDPKRLATLEVDFAKLDKKFMRLSAKRTFKPHESTSDHTFNLWLVAEEYQRLSDEIELLKGGE